MAKQGGKWRMEQCGVKGKRGDGGRKIFTRGDSLAL